MVKARLIVNDNEIPMNDFIENFLINMNTAFVDSLKDIPETIESIKIEIEY